MGWNVEVLVEKFLKQCSIHFPIGNRNGEVETVGGGRWLRGDPLNAVERVKSLKFDWRWASSIGLIRGNQILMMLSIYLLHRTRFSLYFGTNLRSWITNNRVAYITVGGVPIAEPVFCSQ